MLRIFGDFETYWDDQYTLRKLTPAEYILDERYETLCTVVAVEHEDPIFLPKNEIRKFLKGFSKTQYCFISHNALFDATILSYVYNIHPPALLCTMSMARALLSHKLPRGSVALGNVMEYFGLPGKTDALQNTKGLRWEEIKSNGGLLAGFVGYARKDVMDCREIFFRLRKDFPAAEAMIMDRIIRMTTQPRLHVNMPRLWNYHTQVVDEKRQLLYKVNYDRPLLMSNPKFAELLLKHGVEPPMKISKTTGKRTFAFARTDDEFMELLEHDDPTVQTLVAARLGIKSTIEETRSLRFYNIACHTQSEFLKPLMPVPLKFSGAHTHRLSGDWKLNLQNLSSRKGTTLRRSLEAPPGYKLVSVDAAQIEARLVAWLAEQRDLVEQFRNGEDVYCNFASLCFNQKVTRKESLLRFVGKTCILGLGFGMSDMRLLGTLRMAARELGLDIKFDLDDTGHWVNIYRTTFSDIKLLWRRCGDLIERMANGTADGERIGPCVVEGTTIILPSGLRLYYEGLHYEDSEWWFTHGGKRKKIYGAKMVENIVQALDWQHVKETAIRTEKRAALHNIDGRLLLQEHDGNVMMARDEDVDTLASIALQEMRRPCAWAGGLPLDAEVKIGQNYGEMKAINP
jgi:DNA polymerase family A